MVVVGEHVGDDDDDGDDWCGVDGGGAACSRIVVCLSVNRSIYVGRGGVNHSSLMNVCVGVVCCPRRW